MKLHRRTAQPALAFALAAAMTPAMATPIFSDDFNRALSNTVGNGWQEVEGASPSAAADVSIVERERGGQRDAGARQRSERHRLAARRHLDARLHEPDPGVRLGHRPITPKRATCCSSNGATARPAAGRRSPRTHCSAPARIAPRCGACRTPRPSPTSSSATASPSMPTTRARPSTTSCCRACAAATKRVPFRNRAACALAGLGLCLLPWVARRRRRADG